jgi:hypothetical protein
MERGSIPRVINMDLAAFFPWRATKCRSVRFVPTIAAPGCGSSLPIGGPHFI